VAPIIVAFVRYQCVEPFKVPLGDDGTDLGIVPAGGGKMEVQDRLGLGVHKEGDLERPELQLDPLV